MATDLTINFSSPSNLYNAVAIANKLDDNKYNIKLQFDPQMQGGSFLSDLDANNDNILDDNEITDFINKNAGSPIKLSGQKIIYPETYTISRDLNNVDIGAQAQGMAPTIKKSMLIDFGNQYNGASMQYADYIELLDGQLRTNANPFYDTGDSPIASRGLGLSGLRIDDGNANNQINVEIRNLDLAYEKIFLNQPARDIGGYAEFGSLVDNYENLTINGIRSKSITALDFNKAANLRAPFQNRPGANLTLSGDIVIDQAFQYQNSFLWNSGNALIKDAHIYIHDLSLSWLSKVVDFGNATRADGAIVNAVGANLDIVNSEIYQESGDRLIEYKNQKQVSENIINGGMGTQMSIKPRPPSSLVYAVRNFGSASIKGGSKLSGVVVQDGGSLSIEGSYLGRTKASTSVTAGNNLVVNTGQTQISKSIIEDVYGSGSLNATDSVILKGQGSGALSPALLSSLDANKPAVFSDAKKTHTQGGAEFVYQTYDASKLSSNLLTAINNILSGSSGIQQPAHILSATTSFGSILKPSDQSLPQQIQVITENADGASLSLVLNAQLYKATVANNQATFLIPAVDLQALPTGLDSYTISGTYNGQPIPDLVRSFSVVAGADSTSNPGTSTGSGASRNQFTEHITGIDLSFGGILDPKEAKSEQLVDVSTEGMKDGQKIVMTLNAKSYSTKIDSNAAVFKLSADVLTDLPVGLDRLQLKAPGTSAPDATHAFTVLDSSNSKSLDGIYSDLRATKRRDLLTGTPGEDIFLFPHLSTGRPNGKKLDVITGYGDGDQIMVGNFHERVIGAGHKSNTIYNVFGTERNHSKKSINSLLGKKHFRAGDSAVFQVHGHPGSYLAINHKGKGFGHGDMLVYFSDYLPTGEQPLSLI